MATAACSEKPGATGGVGSGGKGSLAAVGEGLEETWAQDSSMRSCWPLKGPAGPPPSAHWAALAQISSEPSKPALTPTLPGGQSLSPHPSAPHPHSIFSWSLPNGLLKDKDSLHIHL